MSKLSDRLNRLELAQALSKVEHMSDEELDALLAEDPVSAQVLATLSDDVLDKLVAGDKSATRYYESLYKQARNTE